MRSEFLELDDVDDERVHSCERKDAGKVYKAPLPRYMSSQVTSNHHNQRHRLTR